MLINRKNKGRSLKSRFLPRVFLRAFFCFIQGKKERPQIPRNALNLRNIPKDRTRKMSHGKFGHLGYLMIEYTKKERE